MNPKVTVVIPNWNGRYLLEICLKSLEKQSFSDFDVMIVDNGSTDESVKFIRKNFPKIGVLELNRNFGFARAVNEGIKNSYGRYLVLLNNDTEADKDYIRYLVEAADRHEEAGFVAAKMLQFDNRNIIDSAGDAVDVVGHSYNIGLGQEDGPEFNKAGEIFLATAGGSLFKREVFEQAGYFDEDYHTYMEDIDLCLRAQFQGFKGWYEPKAVLYHIRKATSSKIGRLSEYWHFRNMTQNVIKDYPVKLFLTDFNWLKIKLVNLNTILYMGKKGFLWEGIKADLWIIFHLPQLLWKRYRIQSSKKVSDDYIIKNIRPKKITLYGLLAK